LFVSVIAFIFQAALFADCITETVQCNCDGYLVSQSDAE